MLGIVAVGGPGVDAGSVGLLMARRLGAAGRPTLLIDASTGGPGLAGRLGAVMQTEFFPAERGLPTLIAAREPLTLESMARHCYRLDGADGLRWALFAPGHPDGAKHAVRWLSERVGELAEVDRQRSIVVACSAGDHDDLLPLLKAMPRLVLLASARTREDAEALRLWCERSGLFDHSLSRAEPRRAVLIAVGPTVLEDDEIEAVAKLPVAGRLPEIDDSKLLRMPGGRRGRELVQELDQVLGFCMAKGA